MKIDVLSAQLTPERWKKCRDAAEGQDAVHKAGTAYLPALTGQDAKAYAAFKSRTPFFNATQRTIDGLVGMVYRKYPTTTAPDAMAEILADLTLEGESADLVSKEFLHEVVTVGRVGALVEYPRMEMGPPTLAQASAMNLRPYVVEYKAEQIENWRMERVNNKNQPVMVKLRETVTEWDGYESGEIDQIRYLILEEGQYIQRLYRKPENGQEWAQWGPDIVPLRRGQPLDFIPFICFGPNELSLEVDKPPIMDLVEMNLSHYRTCADYENGAHFCGVPTPMLAGFQFDEKDSTVALGGNAIVSAAPDAKWGFLEFTGQGLTSLKDLKTEKEAQMAALGSRMLAAEKKQAEAAETVQLRHAGEGAVLSSMAKTVSEGMTMLLQIVADWQGIAGEIDFELNSDFFDQQMSPQELTALFQVMQGGGMSKQTFFWNLKRGERVPDNVDYEDEQTMIETAAPMMTQESTIP